MADPTIGELTRTVQALVELNWRLQGRINALELVCLQNIEDRARLDPDPREFMRVYAERALARTKSVDTDDRSKAQRTQEEMQTALDDFLELVVTRGGDLKL